MDSTKSFKGYGKVDELQEAAFRQKTRKRKIILSISIFLLIALIVGVVAGTLAHSNNNNSSSDSPPTSSALKTICSVTEYPDSCYTSLKSSDSTKPGDVFKYSLMVAMNALNKLADLPDKYISRTDNSAVKEALSVCSAVLNDAVDSLNDTVSSAAGGKLTSKLDDLKTWLSAALTDQETCLDALEEVKATFSDEIKLTMKNSTEYVSNSLAIVAKVIGIVGDFKVPVHRRRLLGFPGWISSGDRRLLQESNPAPDVTVAADGSGDVMTINEAVEKIPKKSETRFVIYVKAGVYVENVELDKSCWNVMIYGDGKNATIVSGSKNYVDRTPTFATATFAVVGKGFIARDIGFRNTAGAEKHQAVALRSGSDQSVFYRCSFDAFQDTLYPHSNRQFYRECDITGTIDFIFGNSAVVFQNCLIQPRQPLPNQFVTITAQGKTDPNQNSGIVIQRCIMSPLDSLTAKAYLGRPWKDYSTTVIMESDIGAFLNPKGWISWDPNVDPPKSIFYAEYRNTGAGANTGSRVNWAGFKPTLTPGQAAKYNVNSFIQGPSWLPAANVNYDST